MYLVVGATGYLGGEICRRLTEAGKPVRALVRPTSEPAKRERLRMLDAELVEGDLEDPASLPAACAGATAVLSTATAIASGRPGDALRTTDEEGQSNLVDAAAEAGVGRFLFVSFIRIPLRFPMQDSKRAVERRLIDSGLTYTILRPSNFMEFYLSPRAGWDVANGRIRVLGPGDSKRNWVALPDVADVAAAAVERDDAANATIEFGGDYAAPNELVAAVEEGTGRKVEVTHVPVEELEAQKAAAEDPLAETFAALQLATALGEEDVTPAIRPYVPRPRTARGFLLEHAALGC